MYLTSKRTQLVVLGLLSLVASRVFFMFINDPEGPNLLIVVVLATVVFGVSLVVLRWVEARAGQGVFAVVWAWCAQVLALAILAVFLR